MEPDPLTAILFLLVKKPLSELNDMQRRYFFTMFRFTASFIMLFYAYKLLLETLSSTTGTLYHNYRACNRLLNDGLLISIIPTAYVCYGHSSIGQNVHTSVYQWDLSKGQG